MLLAAPSKAPSKMAERTRHEPRHHRSAIPRRRLGGRDEGLERQCCHAVLETGDLPLLRYVRAVRPESRDDAAVVP